MTLAPRLVADLFDLARQSLEGAEDAFRRKNYLNAVIETQKAVEYSTKAALVAVGVGPGRQHDTSPVLRSALRTHKFPAAYSAKVRGWARASMDIEGVREVASYPDAQGAVSRDQLVDPDEAGRFVEMAKDVYEGVGQLLRSLSVEGPAAEGKHLRRE